MGLSKKIWQERSETSPLLARGPQILKTTVEGLPLQK